jgi:Flp pilus assembly protein TadB
MELPEGLQQMGFLALVALAVGGLLLAVLFPYFSGAKQTEKRVKSITADAKAPARQGFRRMPAASSSRNRCTSWRCASASAARN